MPYEASLAAILVQFGRTELDFNLTDKDGLFPDQRVSYKVISDKLTEEDILQVGVDLALRHTQEYEARLVEETQTKEEEKKQDNFLSEVDSFLHQKAAEFKTDLDTFVQMTKLTTEEKALVEKFELAWELKD